MSSEAQRKALIQRIKKRKDDDSGLEELIMDVFNYQYQFNPVYNEYLTLLGKTNPPNSDDIVPLPIQFFRSHKIVTGDLHHSYIFESSGTTGSNTSKNYVYDPDFYRFISMTIFEGHFERLEDYCVLALLPSYLERDNSSLVFMVKHFIGQSKFDKSGFFLSDFEGLHNTLEDCKKSKIPTLLFGVSFALIDYIKSYPLDYEQLTIIETGGMKGRGRELTKSEIISQLKSSVLHGEICSEYGMTELFSQFYAKDGLSFEKNPFAKAKTVQIQDPLVTQGIGKPGLLQITDLANLDTCSFILTEDIAVMTSKDTFEILGRADNSVIRGCNLLYAG